MKRKRTFTIAKSIAYALLIVSCQLVFFICYSQNVGIGASAFTPDASAIFEVKSTTQGQLFPSMSTTDRNSIIGTDGIVGHTPATGLFIFNTTTNCFEAYINGAWNTVSCPAACTPPAAPTAGTHTPSQTQIVWNWNPVEFATGYKWNTTNDYSSATWNVLNTTKTQTGFTCNTPNTLYVWSYNAYGHSAATALTQTTSACCTASTVADGTGLTKTTTCVDNYTVIKWTLSGATTGTATWTVPSDVNSVEYLVVAGGGGGGSGSGAGGGGAGGFRTATGFSVTQGAGVTVTVGTGGTDGGAGGQLRGGNGGNSVFGTITSTGGGGGAAEGTQTTPSTGGSGGGAKTGGTGGAASPSGEGNAGGNGGSNYLGGGGGGAGGAGYSGSDGAYPSQGGAGLQSSITGTATWYAGGGGGMRQVSGATSAAGGSGIGGDGGYNDGTYQDATTPYGVANTGSGGGGSYSVGHGGSGIVIIRYIQ